MKNFLVTAFFAAAASTASAQVEIGLKLSPSITSLRTEAPSGRGFRTENSKLTIGGGLLVDYFFGQNYAFSTGLLLVGKGGTFSYFDPATNRREEQKLGLQYLQLPVSIKLFTNDITTDTKLYFQVGGSLNAAIAARINGSKFYRDPGRNGEESKALNHVIKPDAAVLAGLGIERQLGQSTKVLAGVSYHRGLVNIERYFDKQRNFQDISLKNSEVALDLGIKF